MPDPLAGGTATTESAAAAGGASEAAALAGAQAAKQQSEGQGAAAQGAAQAAPEKYEFKMPEGVALDSDIGKQFETVAREVKLPQDKAQALLDLAVKQIQGQQARTMQQWDEQRQAWVQELQRDPEFGGGRFQETVTRAQRTLSKFGSPALAKFLGESGYGDNSELVRMLAKIDRALGEDKIVDGGNAGEAVDVASLLYPSATKK